MEDDLRGLIVSVKEGHRKGHLPLIAHVSAKARGPMKIHFSKKEDRIIFDKPLEQYFGTYEYEMEGEYMEFVKAFEDESFREHLIQKLAERDFLDQTPESVGEKMSNENIIARIEELSIPYDEEFSEYVIDNLKIVKTSEKIIH